jgi:hypothetical protein
MGARADNANSESGPIEYVPGSQHKICQIIGETDHETGLPTVNRTASEAGIVGTDLGFSFEYNGKLVFLFGDTQTSDGVKRKKDEDALAFADLRPSEDGCIHLNFAKNPVDGFFQPPKIPHVANSGYDVPAGGLSNDGKIYIYFTTDHSKKKTMGRSVLGVSNNNGQSFSKVYDFSSDYFINVAPVKFQKDIFLFGSGDYRKSSPYLSVTTPSTLEDKSAVKYFSGLDPETQQPNWSTSEKDSKPLFEDACIGELSVVYDPELKKWLMLYNCGPLGIEMRTADQAWGPWTASQVIFEPARDGAIGKFVGAGVPKAGGVYGPYMVPSFFETNGNLRTIYYMLSTWDPYAVVLMKTDLKLTGRRSLPTSAE